MMVLQLWAKLKAMGVLSFVADDPPEPIWVDGVKGVSMIGTLRKAWGAAPPQLHGLAYPCTDGEANAGQHSR